MSVIAQNLKDGIKLSQDTIMLYTLNECIQIKTSLSEQELSMQDM
jgi:hypothetical protein